MSVLMSVNLPGVPRSIQSPRSSWVYTVPLVSASLSGLPGLCQSLWVYTGLCESAVLVSLSSSGLPDLCSPVLDSAGLPGFRLVSVSPQVFLVTVLWI